MMTPATMGQFATETEKTLRLPDAPDAWIVAILLLVIVAAVAYLYRSESRSVPPLWKGVLGSLRVLTVAIALLIFFQLILAVERTERKDGQVLLLVDRSLSMSFRDKYADRARAAALSSVIEGGGSVEDVPRIDLARAVLLRDDAAFLREMNRRNALRIYAFDSRLQPLLALEKGALEEGGEEVLLTVEAALEEIQADGRETAIGDAINAAVREEGGRLMAGVVLLSDGRSNSGTFTLDRAARGLEAKGGLHAVGIGNPEEPRDISLSNLQANEVVLVDDQVPFDFQVSATGFQGPLELRLVLDGKVEASRVIDVDSPKFRRGIRMEHKPAAPGEYEVRIEAAVKPGELLKENNLLFHHLKVIDEKIRVLYVENFPRWEYRYLKTALIRDPSMQVNCLLLSADDQFPQESSPGVRPIGSFPTEKEDLFEYHVVILGDVDVGSFTEGQLQLLRSFVEDYGGGLLMIAGEGAMPRSYAQSPLEPLVPVRLDEEEGSSIWRATEIYTDPFRPTLTPEGRKSPILRLLDDPAQNLELWEDRDGRAENSLPPLYWHARVGEARPGAMVLAYRETPAGDVPLVALQYIGAGRCFLVNTDETWRWRSGVGDLFFYRFWGQATRFLAGGRLHGGKRVQITTDKAEYTINDQVSVTARIYDRDFRPETVETRAVRIQRPGDEPPGSLDLTAVPNQPGRYAGSFVADRIGLFQLWVDSNGGGGETRAGETSFTVVVPPLEYKDPRMAVNQLRAAAERSGGRYYELDEARALPQAIDEIQEVKRVPESAPIPLWDRWWMLLLFVGVVSAEWIIRKLMNLV